MRIFITRLWKTHSDSEIKYLLEDWGDRRGFFSEVPLDQIRRMRLRMGLKRFDRISYSMEERYQRQVEEIDRQRVQEAKREESQKSDGRGAVGHLNAF